MGTYYIPRNYKGESRILYIFSGKSLITTVVFGMVGFIFYLIFGKALRFKCFRYYFNGTFCIDRFRCWNI